MKISFVDLEISVAELRELAEYIFAARHAVGTLGTIERKIDSMARTQAEFDEKINAINANTSASAAAAQAIQTLLQQLRTDIQNAGLPAAAEEQLFAKLDAAVTTSGQLKAFLEQTAANPTTEPAPVEPPPVSGGGTGTGTGTPTEG